MNWSDQIVWQESMFIRSQGFPRRDCWLEGMLGRRFFDILRRMRQNSGCFLSEKWSRPPLDGAIIACFKIARIARADSALDPAHGLRGVHLISGAQQETEECCLDELAPHLRVVPRENRAVPPGAGLLVWWTGGAPCSEAKCFMTGSMSSSEGFAPVLIDLSGVKTCRR